MKSERSVMAAIRKCGEICAAGEFVSGARLGHTLFPYLAPEAQDAGNVNMRKEPARCHGSLQLHACRVAARALRSSPTPTLNEAIRRFYQDRRAMR
jgi:hypothetical protein